MAYSEKVIDHYNNPRNVGSLQKEDDNIGTGIVGAPACGDVMKLQIKVENNRIVDAKFKTFGCLASNNKIATPKGYKFIKDLKIGDKIWAWNGKEVIENIIENIIKKQTHFSNLYKIDFGLRDKVVCTKDHIWWGVNNKPIETSSLKKNNELLHMTENELRSMNNVRKQDWLKEKNSKRMVEWNKIFDHSILPQNQKGFKQSDEAKINHSIASKKMWESDEYRKNWERGMQGASTVRPTKLEHKFINLFKENNIDVRYVGNGEFWCDSSHLNPDFKVNGQKKVIEVYTSKLPKFMMDRTNIKWILERRRKLEEAGFQSLFLDIQYIDTAINEVQRFVHNGIKIKKIHNITDKRDLRGIERDGEQVFVYDLKLKEGANIYFVQRVMSHNCGSAIASSSLATEWVKGRTLDEALEIKNTQFVEELSLPPVKIHCSVLAEDAIKSAIADYRKKQENVNL